ncbi:hypothetical protein LDENG_00084650, partial [Lucifuga dentata]
RHNTHPPSFLQSTHTRNSSRSPAVILSPLVEKYLQNTYCKMMNRTLNSSNFLVATVTKVITSERLGNTLIFKTPLQ